MDRKNLPLCTSRVLVIVLVMMFGGNAFAGSPEQVLWRFTQNGPAGYNPVDLISDSAGNLYGANSVGGAYGSGTVYELSPPAVSGGPWSLIVLYSFPKGATLFGVGPGSLILDAAGNLYGTTNDGGKHLFGSVFQLTPPATVGGQWTETDIYSFSGWDGYQPGGLALDPAGNLYGTTYGGGRYCAGVGCGTVYQLSPPAISGDPWTRTVLYYFKGVLGQKGNGDGAAPFSVVFDKNGNLDGVTYYGGHCQVLGCGGAVFQLQPPSQKGQAWRESILFRLPFSNGNNGPFSGLVIDKAGALYGSTAASVYQLSEVNGVWTQKVLVSGSELYSGVILDGSGNLYGTTLYDIQNPNGTVYKLTAPNFTYTLLYSFAGGFDGSAPLSAPTFGLEGAIYGTTLQGGSKQCQQNLGCGTVFRVAP
jgi:uncharacterized repeat protein (TIGR03803 family)